MKKRQKKQLLVFPELSHSTEARPSHCPKCGRPDMHWHRGPLVATRTVTCGQRLVAGIRLSGWLPGNRVLHGSSRRG